MKPWFTVNNAASSGPAEILIYEQIGKDWWSGDGIAAKDFAKALKDIPKGQQIVLRVNSPGGNVHDGMAIYSLLKERDVIARIDGVAASIASVICMAAKEVRMSVGALMMIHDPWGLCQGNAADMRQTAEALDKHRDAIAAAYESRCKRPRAEIESAMTSETWFTPAEAIDFGLADAVENDIAAAALFDFSAFRRVPATLQNAPARASGATQGGTDPMKDKIIALLKKHGVTVQDNWTDEQLIAALDSLGAAATATDDLKAEIKAMKALTAPPAPPAPPAPAPAAVPDPAWQARIDALEAQNREANRREIAAAVDECVAQNRIPATQRDAWVRRAVADAQVLNDLRALPQVLPGVAPVNVAEITAESFESISAHMGRLNGASRGQFYDRHRDRILPVMNANTVATELKRQVILQEMMRAFAKRLMPLSAFSTVFRNVALQGTNKVTIPYYALSINTVTDWNAANGYSANNTVTAMKEITVDKRKWTGIGVTSDEFRRQPFLNTMQLMVLEAEVLANAVLADILSLVVVGTFTNTATSIAVDAFDSDNVADLTTRADGYNWPDSARSLLLDTTYFGALLKDPGVKVASAYGGAEPIRDGRIPGVMGFNVFKAFGLSASTPYTTEKLRGFACFPSALLIATSPIEPTPAVRAQLSSYEVIVDGSTGMAFEYKVMADAFKDVHTETVEFNYGRAAGEVAALIPINTP